MTIPTRIAVFHYHLLPGGVTNVIFLSLKALIHHHPAITEILLVVGTAENAGTVADRLRKEVQAAGRDIRIGVSVITEIGYVTPEEAKSIDRQALKNRLGSDYGGFLWWVHNYHIGKNPVFTAALLEAAGENPDQPILLHIHDFPEDGRYYNLSFLQRFAGKEVYPVLPNVRYVVINGRDYRLLTRAGLPEDCVFLLNNPVELRTPPEADPSEIRRRLEHTFGQTSPSYDPDKPLWLYPVRTIRRKNVLEAGLICALHGANLLLTLPGVSKQEQPYSALVQDLYRRGIIPGMWGIGQRLDEVGIDFNRLAVSSDVIISSSVQEGFGYLYTDAVQWRKPLIARNLDILEGIRDVFHRYPAIFYNDFNIPLTSGDVRTLKQRYTRRSKRLRFNAEILAAFLDSLAEGTADFAMLHVELQVTVLERLGEQAFRDELKSLNYRLFGAIRAFDESSCSPDSGVFTRFGPQAFYDTFTRIADSFEQSFPPATVRPVIQDNLVDLFAESDIIRLLYEFQG